MNLVKIAEDLKGVPLQALQSYVNGQNPEVPPYVAAAEMQRRQAQMQRAQMAQGAQQAGAPSVKEQLEEAVGLMSLQQQRQQQAMQQVAQQGQNRPMPTTEGTPQPVGMAGGGIARIPIRDEMFQYAGGGIIGFQEGGQPRTSGQRMLQDFKRWLESSAGAERERRIQQLKESLPAQMFEAVVGFKAGPEITYRPAEGAPSIYAEPEERATFIQEQAAGAGRGVTNPPMASEEQPEYPPVSDEPATFSGVRYSPEQEALFAQRAQQYPEMADAWRAYREQFPDAGMRPAAAQTGAGPGRGTVNPPNVTPSAEDVGIASGAQANKMSEDLLKEIGATKAPEVNLEDIGRQERQLQEQSGIAGLAAQRQKMREEYEASKKDRGLDTMIAGLAGAARGYGGVAAGYLGAKRAQEARDRKFLEDMYALEAAPAEKSYGTQRDMLKEAQNRANEWAEKQRNEGISIKKSDIDRQTAIELENLKQQNRMTYLERQGKLFGERAAATGGQGAGALERMSLTALNSLRITLGKEIDQATKDMDEARVATLKQQLSAVKQALAAKAGLGGFEGATQATDPTRVIDFNSIE